MAVTVTRIIREKEDSVWRILEIQDHPVLELRIMLNDGDCEVLKPQNVSLPKFIKLLTECLSKESNFKKKVESSYEGEKLEKLQFMYNGIMVYVKEDTDWFVLYEKLDVYMGKRKFGEENKTIQIDEIESFLFVDEDAENEWKRLLCEKPEETMSFARRWTKLMQFYNSQNNVIMNIAETAKEKAILERITPQQIDDAAEIIVKCWKFRNLFKEWLKKSGKRS